MSLFVQTSENKWWKCPFLLFVRKYSYKSRILLCFALNIYTSLLDFKIIKYICIYSSCITNVRNKWIGMCLFISVYLYDYYSIFVKYLYSCPFCFEIFQRSLKQFIYSICLSISPCSNQHTITRIAMTLIYSGGQKFHSSQFL